MEKDAYLLASESHEASRGLLTHGPHLRAAHHQRSDRAEGRKNNPQLFVALTRQIPGITPCMPTEWLVPTGQRTSGMAGAPWFLDSAATGDNERSSF